MSMTTASSVKVTFEHLLVPTDFSDISEKAVAYAKSIARQESSEILLIHVNPPLSPITPPEGAWIDEAEIEGMHEEHIQEEGAALRSEGFRAEAICVTGPLQDEILSAIKHHNVDLVVLGTSGKHGLERLMLGSDAEAVLRNASCPVFAVGPETPLPTENAWRPRKILCATTLKPQAAGVAAYAWMLARHFEAEFTLLHVERLDQVPGENWDAFEKAFLQHAPDGAMAKGCLRTLLTEEEPVKSIVDQAKQKDADLIVIGARTASAIVTHLGRGVAPQLLAKATCPVITIQES